MITGDKFYTCDDAERVALRLARNVTQDYKTVVPHYYSSSAFHVEAGGVAFFRHFDFQNPLPLAPVPSKDTIFLAQTLIVEVDFESFPVGDSLFEVTLEFPVSLGANTATRLFRINGASPLTTLMPTVFPFHGVLFHNVNYQINNQAGASIDVSISVYMMGYKISK